MKFKMNGNILYLNKNEVSGDTYPCIDFLKNKMDGKWNAEKKVWVVNVGRLKAFLNRKPWLIIDENDDDKINDNQKTTSKKVDQGLRNLKTDGSLPTIQDFMHDIRTETIAAEDIPYGRN
jgi:hypothetical protein